MQLVYPDEKSRQTQFISAISQVFENLEAKDECIRILSHGKSTNCDVVFHLSDVPEAFVKMKAEFGGHSATDPLAQACLYYREFTRIPAKETMSSLPSFIILVLGRVICFYGAVCYLDPFEKTKDNKIDRFVLCNYLFSYFFDDQDSNTDEVKLIQLYNILSALYKTMLSLKKYRTPTGEMLSAAQFTTPISGNRHFIENHSISKIPNKLVWKNTVAVFKYATRYCFDAHHRAFELGIASELLTYDKLAYPLHFIVMQKVIVLTEEEEEENDPKLEKKFKAWKVFNEQFIKFSKEYVHGDMRDPNILYGKIAGEKKAKFFLIDFDWSGKVSDKPTYPMNIDLEHFSDCSDIKAGVPILPEHDMQMLQKLENCKFPLKDLTDKIRCKNMF